MKERGNRGKDPTSDLQPQIDDINKRFEAYKKEIAQKMSEPVVDPETGEVKAPPFNSGEMGMLSNKIELCI